MAPRAVELLNRNYLFGYDQGLFFEKVKSIVVDHKFTLIGEEVGGRGGFFQGPGFYYLLSLPFLVSGGDPYSVMVLMFGIGVATLILAAYLSYRAFGPTTSLLITFLLAVSPGMISQSRFIWNPFVVPILIVALFFVLYEVIRRKRYMVALLFFIIGMLYHFEIATGIMVTMEFVVFCLYLLWKKIIRLRTFIAGIFVFGLTQIHFLLFDLRHSFLITKAIVATAMGTNAKNITPMSASAALSNHIDVFRHGFISTFVYGSNVWIYIVAGIVVGIYFLMRDRHVEIAKKQFVGLLGLSPILTFILYIRYGSPMWEWWVLDLGVVYIILVGIIGGWAWSKGLAWRIGISVVIGCLLYAHVQDVVRFYKTDYLDYGGTHKIKGKLDALDTIFQDANGQKFNLLVFTPPVYTYPYDYLVWWYGKNTYGYLPGKERNGTFYLLIEPDWEKPWSYKGWLETVIKNGKVIKHWELPSGFIIEKRIEESR